MTPLEALNELARLSRDAKKEVYGE